MHLFVCYELLLQREESKENLNFWSERPAEYAKWIKMVWVEFGCPGHGKGPRDGLGAMSKSKVTLDIMHGTEHTSTGKITSAVLVAQHLRSIFCNKDLDMDHADMKIQQVVVMYLNVDQISRPLAPPIVSTCKGIMASFSFVFLGVPRHYARRSYSCWCTAYSRVRGRGHGSNSCGPNLMVQGCTRTKQTFWIEDEFTVTSSSGIRNRDVRVAEIMARELEKTKPDKWGCVQARGFGHLRRRGRYVLDTSGCLSSARFLEATATWRRSSSLAPVSTRSTKGYSLGTVTAPSWLTGVCIERMKMPQV